jgi:pimeloyl-ACP methyl ester carboxylesterase
MNTNREGPLLVASEAGILRIVSIARVWSRISSPTLWMWGEGSGLRDPEAAGLLAHFKQAELQKIAGAGHWLHHDRLDVVLASLRRFLATPQAVQSVI